MKMLELKNFTIVLLTYALFLPALVSAQIVIPTTEEITFSNQRDTDDVKPSKLEQRFWERDFLEGGAISKKNEAQLGAINDVTPVILPNLDNKTNIANIENAPSTTYTAKQPNLENINQPHSASNQVFPVFSSVTTDKTNEENNFKPRPKIREIVSSTATQNSSPDLAKKLALYRQKNHPSINSYGDVDNGMTSYKPIAFNQLVNKINPQGDVKLLLSSPPLNINEKAQWLNYSPSGQLLAFPKGLGADVYNLKTGKIVIPNEVSLIDKNWYGVYQINNLAAQTINVDSDSTQNNFSDIANQEVFQTNQPNINPSLKVGAGKGVEIFPMNHNLATAFENNSAWSAISSQAVGQPFSGHENIVFSLKFYPDASRIVSGGGDGTLRVWDIAGNRQIGAPIDGHNGLVFAVTISPDGTKLASAGNDGAIKIWDANSGAQILPPLLAQTGDIYSLRFSRDGNRLYSAGSGGVINIWDTVLGGFVGSLSGHTQTVYAMDVSADGSYLASAGADGKIIIWDLSKSEKIREITGVVGITYALAFSKLGDIIAATGNNSQVNIWSTISGEKIGEPFYADGNALFSLAISPDGLQISAGSFNHKIWIWDIITGKANPASPFSGHSGWVSALSYDPTGTYLASGSADGTVRLWRAPTVSSPIIDLAKSSPSDVSGKMPISSPSIQIIEPNSTSGMFKTRSPNADIVDEHLNNSTVFDRSNDGMSWVVATEKGIEQFDAKTNTPKVKLAVHKLFANSHITAIKYSSNDNYIVVGNDAGYFAVFGALSGKLISYLPYSIKSAVRAIAISQNEEKIAVATDNGEIQVFRNLNFQKSNKLLPEDQSWLPLYTLNAHAGRASAIAFVGNDTLISGGEDKKIFVYNLLNGKTIEQGYEGQFSPIITIAVSPNNREITTGGLDGSIQRWQILPDTASTIVSTAKNDTNTTIPHQIIKTNDIIQTPAVIVDEVKPKADELKANNVGYSLNINNQENAGSTTPSENQIVDNIVPKVDELKANNVGYSLNINNQENAGSATPSENQIVDNIVPKVDELKANNVGYSLNINNQENAGGATQSKNQMIDNVVPKGDNDNLKRNNIGNNLDIDKKNSSVSNPRLIENLPAQPSSSIVDELKANNVGNYNNINTNDKTSNVPHVENNKNLETYVQFDERVNSQLQLEQKNNDIKNQPINSETVENKTTKPTLANLDNLKSIKRQLLQNRQNGKRINQPIAEVLLPNTGREALKNGILLLPKANEDVSQLNTADYSDKKPESSRFVSPAEITLIPTN